MIIYKSSTIGTIGDCSCYLFIRLLEVKSLDFQNFILMLYKVDTTKFGTNIALYLEYVLNDSQVFFTVPSGKSFLLELNDTYRQNGTTLETGKKIVVTRFTGESRILPRRKRTTKEWRN